MIEFLIFLDSFWGGVILFVLVVAAAIINGSKR